MILTPNRHNRGWSKVALLTYIVEMEQSYRFCIDPMGQRDAIWERSGYVELIQWKKLKESSSSQEIESNEVTDTNIPA